MRWDKILRWGPAILCAAGIFTLSSISKLPQPPGLMGQDKLNHLIAYFFLGLFTLRALAWKQSINLKLAAAALLITIIFGATDEWHQSFVPGRYTDFLDWVSDAAGGILGITALVLYNRTRNRRQSNNG